MKRTKVWTLLPILFSVFTNTIPKDTSQEILVSKNTKNLSPATVATPNDKTPMVLAQSSDDFMLSPKQEEKFKEILAEEFDNVINIALKQLNQLDKALEHLALIVHNGLIKTKNKSNVFSELKNLRQFVEQIKTIARNNPYDISKINLVLCLTDTLADHIYYAVRRGLTRLPEFKISDGLARIKRTNPSFEQFEKLLYQTNKKIQNLENDMNNIKSDLSEIKYLLRNLTNESR